MQHPTCTNVRVRTARDADIIFHAVALGILPMVTRRLDSEERMALTSGCVYVWEERTSNVSESLDHGIERFTEGRSWGPSRARDDFLFYNEKESAPKSMMVERTRALRYQEDPVGSYAMRPRRPGEHMVKQTYSVYIHGHDGMKKWHLNAYWTPETLDSLATVDDHPHLRSFRVPEGLYVCARTNRVRESAARHARAFAPHHPHHHAQHHPHLSPVHQHPYAYDAAASPVPSSPPSSAPPSPPTPASAWTSPPSPPSSTWSPLQAHAAFPHAFPPATSSSAANSASTSPSSSSSASIQARDPALMLAPLEALTDTRRARPRDPADEVVLRSLDRRRW